MKKTNIIGVLLSVLISLFALGYDADICIFNADTIIDRAEYVNCHERCVGLSYVILGGEVVVKDAVFCGNKKGRFIPDEERFES